MVDDTPGPRAADMCSIGGVDSLSQDDRSDDHCDPVLPEEQNSPSASAAAPEAATTGKEADFASSRTQAPRDNVEETEAVRRLDEELEELERLMVLQRRKVDALERLRRQWLSGERKIPAVRTLGAQGLQLSDGKRSAPTAGAYDAIPYGGREHPGTSRPTSRFEHHMMPHAKIRLSSRVIATEMLSFRLRGKSRPSNSSKKHGGSDRSGYLTVLAFLHADGMVRFRDTNGEELLAFDAGHSGWGGNLGGTSSALETAGGDAALEADTATAASATPVVVGLTGDASEGDPVLVTAGADGTMRVHALTVRFLGKRVAGVREGGKQKPLPDGTPGSRRHREPQAPTTGEVAEGAGDTKKTQRDRSGSDGDRRHGGGGDGPPYSSSTQATATGIGITAEFRVCLGSECRDDSRGGQTASGRAARAAEEDSVDPTGEGVTEAAEGLPREEPATVLSMDAFYHRALGTTVVIAGYSTGGVRFFHGGNGTMVGSVDTDNAVRAVERSGQTIAYSDGEDVRFASATKLQQTPDRVCRGGWGSSGGGGGGDRAVVTALAFDAVSPGILYAGSETGEVMAFNSRLQDPGGGSYLCLAAYRLLPPPRPMSPGTASYDQPATAQAADTSNGDNFPEECNAISTVRGYTIVSQGSLLSVYNTTEEAHLLFTRRHPAKEEVDCGGVDVGGSPAGAEGDAPLAPEWAVMSSPSSGEVLVAEATRCSVEAIIYKASLPYERHGPDMSWMRVPILLLGLLIVALTQVCSRRAAKSAVGGRNRRISRRWRDDISDDDMTMEGPGLGRGPDLTGLSRRLSEGRVGQREYDGLGSDVLKDPSRRVLPPRHEGYLRPWEEENSD